MLASYNRRVDFPPILSHISHLATISTAQYPPCHIHSSITFGEDFNCPLFNPPPSLTHLTFGYEFNQPVDSLPLSLIYLSFGYSFDHPLNSLPPSLTHLTIGHLFMRPLCSLPPSVTHLKCTKWSKTTCNSFVCQFRVPWASSI
jgi:hypothetical protein